MNETLRKSISVVYKLAFLLSVLIFINILFGPLVRATDSGLACPDWPLCHGKVIPPQSLESGWKSGIESILVFWASLY